MILSGRVPAVLCCTLLLQLHAGEAAADPAALMAAIAKAASAAPTAGSVPDWVKDPTLDGKLAESSYGSGEDLGLALANGLSELAACRAIRQKTSKTTATISETTSQSASGAKIVFGEIAIASLAKDYVDESTAGAAKTVFESMMRITCPAFTIKMMSKESGEITKDDDRRSAQQRVSWTSVKPLSGNDVVRLCAAGGVMLAANWSDPKNDTSFLWLTAVAKPVQAPAAGGYLLPLQAGAVALAGALGATGDARIPGVEIGRPTSDTLHLAWKEGDELTIRFDGSGSVVGVDACTLISTASGAPMPTRMRAAIQALGAQVAITRSGSGELWTVTRR